MTANAGSRQIKTNWGVTSQLPKRLKDLAKRFSTPLALIGGVIVWEIVGRLTDVVFFAPFSEVVQAWLAMVRSGRLAGAMLESLPPFLIGFGFSVVLGLLVGTMMGLSETVRYLLDIYVNTLMAAPLIALIPIIAIFLGLSFWGRTAVVFIFAFFAICANTEAGMRAAGPELLEMAQSFGLNRRKVFLNVILPGAMPAVLTGLRQGLIRAVRGIVTGEMFLAIAGVGGLLDYYGSQFKAAELFAVILTVIAVSIFMSYLIFLVTRRLTRWESGIARE